MLSSSELHTLYEGLQLNSVTQYDYVLTGKARGGRRAQYDHVLTGKARGGCRCPWPRSCLVPAPPPSRAGDVCRPELGGTLVTTMPR